MTLETSDIAVIHQHSGSWHKMRLTHRPTGVSIQVEGHNGYFDLRNEAYELLEKEVVKNTRL